MIDDIVNQHNTYRTIKMKSVDVEDNTYIDLGKESNDKDPTLIVGDHVRIWKYKSIFAEGYTPNCSEEVFVIKKVKNTVPWPYVIHDLNGKEIIVVGMGSFKDTPQIHLIIPPSAVTNCWTSLFTTGQTSLPYKSTFTHMKTLPLRFVRVPR